MQRLLTIYLDSTAMESEGWSLRFRNAERHGLVEEHLSEELAAGWRIVQVHSLGGAEGMHVRGWLTVLLERDPSA